MTCTSHGNRLNVSISYEKLANQHRKINLRARVNSDEFVNHRLSDMPKFLEFSTEEKIPFSCPSS